jgi:hypothetical protein
MGSLRGICGISYDTNLMQKWYHKGNHMNKRIVKYHQEAASHHRAL